MLDATASSLRLTLFGTPLLAAGTTPVRLSLKRGYALLAYLALEGRPVPREHAASLLWPRADVATGRARLRRLVYQVEELCGRRTLFDAHEQALALAAQALHCDAIEFRQRARLLVAHDRAGDDGSDEALEALVLRAVLPLLDGLDIGSDAFDDWVRTQRVDHEHLLARALVRLAERQRALGRRAAAAESAERLLKLDPYAEPAYVLRMALAADQRDGAGVDAVFTRCADALRAEFGTRPAPATENAYVESRRRAEAPPAAGSAAGMDATPASETPLRVRFASGRHGPVAYATLGQGSEVLVVMSGFVSHIEIAWDHPGLRDALAALAQRFTVVLFDRRGVGLSERLGTVSTVESAADDVLTILDSERIERAWLFGSSEGGPAAIHVAAVFPRRVRGLVLFGSLARGSRAADYPWALQREAFDRWMEALIAAWGGPADIETFAPTLRDDPPTRAWWARMLRHSASPASMRAVLEGLRDADVRVLLPRIDAPTLVMHRRGDRAVRFQAGEHLAASIRGATFMPMDGDSHWWWVGDPGSVVAAIADFTGRMRPAATP